MNTQVGPTGALPVMGEISDPLWEAIREGQPVVLTWHGRPAAVVLDVDSYLEVEEADGQVA